jgi:hypothetical protein
LHLLHHDELILVKDVLSEHILIDFAVKFVSTPLLFLAVCALVASLITSNILTLTCNDQVVLSQLASSEVGLVHLHGVHWHLEHAASTAVRWCSSIRHASEDLAVHLVDHVDMHSNALKIDLLECIVLLSILDIIH